MSGQIKSIPVTTVEQARGRSKASSPRTPSVDVDEHHAWSTRDNKVLGRDNGPPTIGISWYHTDRSAVNITSAPRRPARTRSSSTRTPPTART
ncbi:hypothetical protein ACU686_05870 [Yinghuangia aomiensis]